MADTDDLLNDAIENALQTPQSVSVDGQSVMQRSVDDLLTLEKMLSSKKAKRCNGFGIKFVTVEYPGSQR